MANIPKDRLERKENKLKGPIQDFQMFQKVRMEKIEGRTLLNNLRTFPKLKQSFQIERV